MLRVVVLLLVMDTAIHFHNKKCDMTVKIDDEAVNHLLTAKVQSRKEIATKMLPKDRFSRRHCAAEFARLIAEGVRMMNVSATHKAPTPGPSPASGRGVARELHVYQFATFDSPLIQ